MTIPLTVKPRCSKTLRIYEPPDESEGTISLRVVLRISFAAHMNIIATTPNSSWLESRCDQTSHTHSCMATLHCLVSPDFRIGSIASIWLCQSYFRFSLIPRRSSGGGKSENLHNRRNRAQSLEPYKSVQKALTCWA